MSKVITGKVRFSYANVFVPTSMEEDQPKKYNVVLLIPKSDKATVKKIQDAVEAAELEGKISKWNGKIPATLKRPLRDGDAERPDDEIYAGHFFVNANSKNKPGVVDTDVQPIISEDEFYSGCYGRASVNFYPFNASGNKGVACGLNNVQKTEDGERLSGGASAEEDFGGDDDDMM